MQVDKIYFVHLREQDEHGHYINNSGITFAWKVEKDGRLIIGKPAICWATDIFVKAKGRELALNNLTNEDALLVIQSDHIKMLAIAQCISSMNFADSLTPRARLRLFQHMVDEIDADPTAVMTTRWYEGLIHARFFIEDGHLRYSIDEAFRQDVLQITNTALGHLDLEDSVLSTDS